MTAEEGFRLCAWYRVPFGLLDIYPASGGKLKMGISMNCIQIEVEIDQGVVTASSEDVSTIQVAVQTILRREGFSESRPVSVTILLTGDAKLRQLNRDYAGEDHTTDVLSFATEPDDGFPLSVNPEQREHIGDIAISIPQTGRQARDKGVPFERELAMLAIHGTLHLLGYDHATKPEERIMFGKTDHALNEVFG